MANATSLPSSTQMRYFDWKGDPHFTRNPAIDGSGTYTLYWSVAPLDSNDAIITGGFEVTSTAKDGENYTFWVPASAVAADGLSATGCVGGIRPNGLDYTTKDTTFAPTSTTILAGMKITCGLPAVLGELLRAAIQGVIQTGSVSINIGTGSSEDAYIYHNGNPWLKQTSAGVAQYWNGSSYVSFNDSIASSLVKVSATDTTPDYLQGKVGSSDASITISVTGSGADETLNLVTSLPARISSHAVYTPAYMTGGTSAETNTALWDSLADASFRATVDGTAYNFDAIDLTGITSMADVASTIQTKMRTVTGTTLTVVWSTNKFVITSSNTTSSSQISVLSTSTGTVGTDISGAGAGTWMDSETGRGTATAAVLNPAADSGKIDLLDSAGQHKKEFLKYAVDQTNGYAAKGSIQVATAEDTPANFNVGADDTVLTADSAQSTGVKYAEIFGLGSRGRLYYNSPLIGTAGGLNSTRSAAGAGTGIQFLLAATSILGATGLVSTTLTNFAFEWVGAFTGATTYASMGLAKVATRFDDDHTVATDGAIRIFWDGTTTLRAVSADGAYESTVIDTGYAAGEKRLFRVVYTTAQILFYMNNTLVATHSTAVPAVAPTTTEWGFGGGGQGAGTHGEEIYMPNISILTTDLYTT